ncbi:hypothetical protein MPRF_04500 [Mycolicibacterium parafortuitum]|uniref:Uncharacterized protein n=1 Tax=Mycolicibacterium parafortuitum TaxID=39692 RepID=A0A7I7TY38_MYCPF|nr:hypothetical protein MPRF_04500 [Mycolicibacterium parafortuitum]
MQPHTRVRLRGIEVSGEFDGTPLVVCPQGHANAWHYRFCGQCGSPIGAVAYPDDGVVESTSLPRRRGWLIGGVVAAVSVVAAAVTAGVLLVGSSTDEAAVPQTGGFTAGTANPAAAVPTCATAPLVQAESVDMTPDGLTVDAAFMSQCPGGNTETASSARITVADGQRDIAAGLFDFSASPLTMKPGETVRRTLVFPAGMYWRTTEMFSGAPQLVFHSGDDTEVTSASSTVGSQRVVAHTVAEPEHGSIDGVAEAVLRELRDADYAYVSGSLANRWIPQISAKKAGLVVDGRTLTSTDVLRNHLALRDKYSNVRLLSSGQWTTFSSGDFWVTVVGQPKLSPAEANAWCDAQRIRVDDCFAKFVSSLFGVEGTTAYRK